MNFCPNCGKPLGHNKQFCTGCGTKTNNKSKETKAEHLNKSTRSSQTKKTGWIVYSVIGILLLLGLSFLLINNLIKNHTMKRKK